MAAGNRYLVIPGTTRATGGPIVLNGLDIPTSTAWKVQGGFDLTFQILEGTIASTSNINVQYTLSPNYATSTQANLWVNVSTLSLTTSYVYLVGHTYAVRFFTTTNSVDSFGIAMFYADKR